MLLGVRLSANRNFRLLWLGQTATELGAQLSLVSFPLLVLALTGSAAKAGVVGLARQLPVALCALPAGELADRVDRRWLMAGCDALRAAAMAALVLAIALGDVPFGLIAAVAFLDGAAFTTAYITERGLLRQVVAHVITYDALRPSDLLRRTVRAGGNIHRVNDSGVSDRGQADAAALIAEVRRNLTPHGLVSLLGGRPALTAAGRRARGSSRRGTRPRRRGPAGRRAPGAARRTTGSCGTCSPRAPRPSAATRARTRRSARR